MAYNAEKYSLFGCTVRGLVTQFGLNQNPSVITANLVRDIGETFTLDNLKDKGILSNVTIALGSLNVLGIVQSWEQVEVDIAGKNVYTVRMTDAKPVLAAGQILLHRSQQSSSNPVSVDYGDNVVPIVGLNASDLNKGIKYSTIAIALKTARIKYGSYNYRINLSSFITPGSNYYVKGGAMSVLDFIQQVADDHGYDWYIETSLNRTIYIKKLNRDSQKGISFSTLGTKGSNVIHQSRGYEYRDVARRHVLIGAQKQELAQIAGTNWEQFWGWDSDGKPKSYPEFRINYTNGDSKDIRLSTKTMNNIINDAVSATDDNDGLSKMSEEQWQSARAYLNEYWGRKFYTRLAGDYVERYQGIELCWVDVASAGWWSNSIAPGSLSNDGRLKFETEDKRWTAFIKLHTQDPWKFTGIGYGTGGWKWDDRLVMSPNLYRHENGFYMAVRVEKIFTNNHHYLVMTLPTQMGIYVRLSEQQAANAGFIENRWITRPDGSQYLRRVTAIINRNIIESFDTAWVPLIDYRCTYGPWYNAKNTTGKVEVVIDTTLSPWNFAHREMTVHTAELTMDQVAETRVKSLAKQSTLLSTGKLEVEGLPSVNLGELVETCAHLNTISVNWGLDGVTTNYQASEYTDELGRYRRMYQELVDDLKRKQAIRNNTLQPQPNYMLLDTEMRGLMKGIQDLENLDRYRPDDALADDAQSLAGQIARITSRYTGDAKYNLTILEEIKDGDTVSLVIPTLRETLTGIRNIAEPIGIGARLPVGSDVTVKRSSTGGYYIDQVPDTPPSFVGTIASVTPGYPKYKITAPDDYPTGDTSILLPSEIAKLAAVVNLGEPIGEDGYLLVGTSVEVSWNNNGTNTYTPYISQPVTVFKT